MQDTQRLDVIVIGAGIAGVTALHYARRAGLSALALEKQHVVGGLWARLPAWQDIQNNRHDWALGNLPIDGEDSASVAKNIRAWVDEFDLAPSILLDTPVIRATPIDDGWRVSTPRRDYLARHLVSATGAHNLPFIPQIDRHRSRVSEFHSSALDDPAVLAGRDVVVVGGGASAYDLLDLCLEHAARRVTWVYRSLKWMMPTRKVKHLAADIRGMAKMQMADTPVALMSRAVNQDLRARYEKFGIADICPTVDFDFRRDQLIPGRRRMIEHFGRIERFQGEVAGIDGATVRLSSGAQLEADLLLWGTGYEMDLSYFDVPQLACTRRPEDLARRCGSLFVSRDAPNLYFLAPSVLETTSVSPWSYSMASRTIVSHMCGHATLGAEPVGEKLSYFDLVGFLAPRDPENFQDGWKAQYRQLLEDHPDGTPLPIP